MTFVRANFSCRASSEVVSTGVDRLKQFNSVSAFLTVLDDSGTYSPLLGKRNERHVTAFHLQDGTAPRVAAVRDAAGWVRDI